MLGERNIFKFDKSAILQGWSYIWKIEVATKNVDGNGIIPSSDGVTHEQWGIKIEYVDAFQLCYPILENNWIMSHGIPWLVLSRPQTINLYDGFVCHDDVVVVASTSDYWLGRSD